MSTVLFICLKSHFLTHSQTDLFYRDMLIKSSYNNNCLRWHYLTSNSNGKMLQTCRCEAARTTIDGVNDTHVMLVHRAIH